MHTDDEIEETAFDFSLPGGAARLVDTVIKELAETEPEEPEEPPAQLSFPPVLKKPESREQPTMLMDSQQASLDHVVAASLITGEHAPGPPVAPVPQRVIVGVPAEAPLALNIEAIAARPARSPAWVPVQAPESAGLPVAFWIVIGCLTLIVIAYAILS